MQRDKSGNWHPIYREGLWGYVDNEGRVVVKPRFNWASDFSEGRAAVAIWKTEQCGFIRPDGSWAKLLPRGAVIGWPFSESRAWYREGQLFGCIDADGNVRIPPRYDDAQQFSEGLARVGRCVAPGRRPRPNGDSGWRYGYVDRSGREVIPLQFSTAGGFRDGLALTWRPGSWDRDYIDRGQGCLLTPNSIVP